MCVCVGWGGGGGGFFYLQITKRRLCGLVAVADSCQGKKDNYIYSILDILTRPIEYSPIFNSCYSTVRGRALMAVKFKLAMKNS